jgi:hypothetical protein
MKFSKIELKNVFINFFTLFFSIILVSGLIFISTNQIKAEGEDCDSDLPCDSDDEVCVGATDDEFGECRASDDTGGEAGVGGHCSSASDCQSGLECQRNSCTLPDDNDGGGGMCTDDSDCTGDLECVSGACVSVDSSPSSSGGGAGIGISNPLSANTIPELIATVLSSIIGLIGILAVASFVYGGILYMTSGGSEEQSNKGKKVLLYSTMGLIVSILSYVIINTVIRAITG